MYYLNWLLLTKLIECALYKSCSLFLKIKKRQEETFKFNSIYPSSIRKKLIEKNLLMSKTNNVTSSIDLITWPGQASTCIM